MTGTYWEHGIGHMNAEQGSETVKSSLSLAVPSSDCKQRTKSRLCYKEFEWRHNMAQ